MAANESRVLMFGFVGKDPTRIGQPGSTPVCSFRLGSTPAYYDTARGVWTRRPTTWITVKAFRSLAMNLLQSLHKGDPVMVSGGLVTEEWTSGGQPHSTMVLEADGVGHDLNLGQGSFIRIKPDDPDSQGFRDPWDGKAEAGAGGNSEEAGGLESDAEGEDASDQHVGAPDPTDDTEKASEQSTDAF